MLLTADNETEAKRKAFNYLISYNDKLSTNFNISEYGNPDLIGEKSLII